MERLVGLQPDRFLSVTVSEPGAEVADHPKDCVDFIDLVDNLANRRAVRRKPRDDLVHLLVHGETALVASNLPGVFHWPWRARGTAPANAHTVRLQPDEPLHLVGGNASAVNRKASVLLDPHHLPVCPNNGPARHTGGDRSHALRRSKEPGLRKRQGIM